MTAAGLPATVVRGALEPPRSEAGVAALLRPPGRPTAVIAGSDALAAACYAAAAAAGLRIGPDLAVTGFDGSLISRLLTPTLTTREHGNGPARKMPVATPAAYIEPGKPGRRSRHAKSRHEYLPRAPAFR